jgi:hypothetical protein
MEAASLTLSRDELLVFLDIVGVSSINGMDLEPLSGLSDEEIATRMNSGELSLVERGLIEFLPHNRLQLDDTLAALAGAAVIPEATLLLTRLDADGASDPHYFSLTPELYVEHFSPKMGIFQFDHLVDQKSVELRIETLLAPLHALTNAYPDSRITWTATALRDFLEQCRAGDPAKALALLPPQMDGSLAQEFRHGCSTQPMWVVVAGWGLRDKVPAGGDSIMVIPGGRACWLIEQVDAEAETISISTATGPACERAVLELLDSLAAKVAIAERA